MKSLELQKQHLSDLLVAIDRCVYFLNASKDRIEFPIEPDFLQENKNDVDLFAMLSAINERFSKLQDILSQAMRHASILLNKDHDNFLKVLAFYEKTKVIESVEKWQTYRLMRNEATHDYGISHRKTAAHFNDLKELIVPLTKDATCFVQFCKKEFNL